MHLLLLATSRFAGDLPPGAESDLKALLPTPDGRTLFENTLDAALAVSGFTRRVVVGPKDVETVVESCSDVTYLAEGTSDYDSLLRGFLACADSHRVLICGAHLPLVDADALDGLVSNAPADAGICLPLFPKEEFRHHCPEVRNTYLKLADGEVTAPPLAVVQGAAMLRAEPTLRKMFESRHNYLALAGMLGLGIVTKFMAGRLTLEDVRRKAESLMQCTCTLMRTCSPRLALSVTTPQSWEDIAALLERRAEGSA